jgi:glycosyltransferase involved in cell wall biosynthesis
MTTRTPTAGTTMTDPLIAVIVPCYNEGRAIHTVVAAFRAALPGAEIYVYDNNSTDDTIEVARQAGAHVFIEPMQGKGNVVRRMFADVEADVYVLTDGDATYDAASAPGMVDLLLRERLDMVVGCRVDSEVAAYRPGHRFGNALLTRCTSALFGRQVTDMLSGYRVFSRRFVKSFPALSKGFEIETELTVHALELSLPVREVDTPYGVRTEGSTSKLRTYRDGMRILRVIAMLFKDERPLLFFVSAAVLFAILGVVAGVPIIVEFLKTGLVPRLPTAVLASGLLLMAALSSAAGLILDTVTRGRREMKRLMYLATSQRCR